MGNRTYSREFKLQIVLEALQSDGTDAEVARVYDVHPVTLSGWKTKLKENGSQAFGGSDELKEKKDKIANPVGVMGNFNDGPGMGFCERMFGKTGVEIVMGNLFELGKILRSAYERPRWTGNGWRPHTAPM